MRALILVLGILAIMPSAALGAQVARENPIAVAVARAELYWHAKPCGGSPITVTIATWTPAAEEAEARSYHYRTPVTNPPAWSEWQSPSGPNSKISPTGTYTDCTVVLNRYWYPNWTEDDEAFSQLCETFLHEWGNLLGIPENIVPRGDIMDAELTIETPP